MEDEIIQNDAQLNMATKALAVMENADQTPVKTPIEEVEVSVSDFVKAAIAFTLSQSKLSNALEEDLVNSLPEMKVEQKIALFNIDRSSSNDRLFKLLSPAMGLINEKQRAEIEKTRRENEQKQMAAVQINVGQQGQNALDAQIASQSSAEVIGGANAMYQLMQAMAAAAKNTEGAKESTT